MKSICNRKNLIPHHSQGKIAENARSHSVQCAPLGCTRIRELLVPALRAFCFLLSLLHPSFPLPLIRNFTSVAVLDLPWGRRLPGPGRPCATQDVCCWKSWKENLMPRQLPARCLPSAVLQEQLLFTNCLEFMKKRKRLNDGKQKPPKPYFLPFCMTVISVAVSKGCLLLFPQADWAGSPAQGGGRQS